VVVNDQHGRPHGGMVARADGRLHRGEPQ
jgi:hypothetical protein